MHGGFFLATRDSSGYCDWPQSNAEKHGAVKDKLFPAIILRRGAAQRSSAQRSAARRSLQSSPFYDKQYNLSFLTRGAASGGDVPLHVIILIYGHITEPK